MSLDIHTAIQTALFITIVALIFSVWQGTRLIRRARTLPFFRMRRVQMTRGWRLLFIALFLAILAFLLPTQAEPLIYRVFPPTPTFTLTPTITRTPTLTVSPTITLTPSITPSPAISYTPTTSPTPHIPLAIELEFESTTTPNPEAVFSKLTFTDGLDEQYRPLKPGEIFQNPIDHMYGLFSYDSMIVGSQWSALWYRGDELVHYETIPWNGGSGGIGFTDWEPGPHEWLSGEYEVQIFAGMTWKRSGRFTVQGDPPTAVPSLTPTPTMTPTKTNTPTRTPWPSATPIPTWTRIPTVTPRPTSTTRPTATRYLSPTPTRSPTPWPSRTPSPVTPSITPWPTRTRTPIPSITPTIGY